MRVSAAVGIIGIFVEFSFTGVLITSEGLIRLTINA